MEVIILISGKINRERANKVPGTRNIFTPVPQLILFQPSKWTITNLRPYREIFPQKLSSRPSLTLQMLWAYNLWWHCCRGPQQAFISSNFSWLGLTRMQTTVASSYQPCSAPQSSSQPDPTECAVWTPKTTLHLSQVTLPREDTAPRSTCPPDTNLSIQGKSNIFTFAMLGA